MTAKQDKESDEVKRLFAELDAAYRRAAEAASSDGQRGKLVDEGDKALDIIKRIRALDRL